MMLRKNKMLFIALCLSSFPSLIMSNDSISTANTIGSILWMAGDKCPANAHVADGTILPTNQYDGDLFSLIGNIYGGSGETFALPDLRGRTVVAAGTNSESGQSIVQGDKAGLESYSLSADQLPAHTHDVSSISVTVHATTADASSTLPSAYVAPSTDSNFVRNVATADKASMSVAHVTEQVQAMTIEHIEGAQPLSIRSPYVAMTPCIVTSGNYPARE